MEAQKILQVIKKVIEEKKLKNDNCWRILVNGPCVCYYCTRLGEFNLAIAEPASMRAVFFSYDLENNVTSSSVSYLSENTYGKFYEFAERNANSFFLR